MNRKLSILYVAGVSPYHFANMVLDNITALERAGHSVDFITCHEFDRRKANMYAVYKLSLIRKIRKYYLKIPFLIRLRKAIWGKKNIIGQNKPIKDGCLMAHDDERISPVPEYLLFKKLRESYDLVITSVWENIISAETIKLLANHYRAPIIIHPADMYPFTGGCQYPGNCTNYHTGCGRCPILSSDNPKDQTHLNYMYKKEVYSSTNCALVTNTYMLHEANKCGLFENVFKKKKIFTLNEDVYRPLDMDKCRKELNIPQQKEFVMFARYVNPANSPRKGINEMIDAINLFCKDKKKEDISKMCIVFAGGSSESIHSRIRIDVIDLGMLSTVDLIKAYNASSIFVSPSIGDAGPSMVNQAIMCGTPVVCFEIGTAIDVVDHKVNGYKAPLSDTEELAKGFEYFWELSKQDYIKVRENTSRIGIERQSLASYAKTIMDVYEELSHK